MNRPDPDKLLKQVKAEEALLHRGQLKLFFGASPGVGKTYAMLEAARQRKREGWDVVLGLVETHQRAETEALLAGFEILPRKDVPYKGVMLQEFDLDAALLRRPRLLVVDELAHANAPGLRHAKRWQDVEELLDAGIDVYTTLNVQHWESLNDVVAQITGVFVSERVPDTFLKRVHELELVDLAPEDLLTRLKDGKVYKGEIAGRAAENFFNPGNLIALRELALRHAAERVDEQMQAYKERHAITEVWPVGERLLVGVSASPMSARLLRATSRMAGRLRAEWIAAHVETPAFLRLPAEERARVTNNLRLAERLGAETVTLNGADVTEELLAHARARNVTRIVLGKPAAPRWKEWFGGSVVSQMARRCGTIDLHIISGVGPELSDRHPVSVASRAEWTGVGPAALVVTVCTLIAWPLFRSLNQANIVMIYLIGVMFAAFRFGRKASLMASVLSVVSFDFFFVPPYMTFAVSDTQYLLTFATLLGAGLLISTMAGRLRQQTDILRERGERTRILYKLSRGLSETPDPRQMLEMAKRQLEEYYKMPIILLIAGPQGNLEVGAGDPDPFGWSDNELSVAQWVFDRGQLAGAGSDTLSGAHGLYVPMKGIRTVVGALGIRPDNSKALLDPERLQLFETFAAEIGGALESTRMSEEIGRNELQMERQAISDGMTSPSVRLSELLRPERILILEAPGTGEDVIRSLIAVLRPRSTKAALRAVLDRERTGSTRLGAAVAIPHARLDGLTDLQVALAICKQPPIHVWVLFLSPNKEGQVHLAFLANVAAFFRDEARASTLGKLTSKEEVLAYIRQNEVR